MRKIDKIIIHCTATPEGSARTVEEIRRYHVEQLGWNDIGYHYLISIDGSIHAGRPENVVGAHTAGHNRESIGVCYVGGCDQDMKPKDTRTPAQEASLVKIVRSLLERYPGATVHGHREFARKACPCFDVQSWWENVERRM